MTSEGAEPTPVRVAIEGDREIGLLTVVARSLRTNAVLGSKVASREDCDRLIEGLANLDTQEVEPVAVVESVLGPMERYPDLTGCVHSDDPHGMCGSCGRRLMGYEPGEPEYRWNDG